MSTYPVTVDRDNVNDEFVVIRKLYKRDGDPVRAEELVLEIESSKTISELSAPSNGLLRISAREGDEIAVGGLLFEVIADGNTAYDSVPASEPSRTEASPLSEPVVVVKASRAASELAQRLGVALQDIPSRGWITSADLLAITTRGRSAAAAPVTSTPTGHALVAEKSRAAAPRVPFRSQTTSLLKRREARILANANSNGTTSLIGTEITLSGARLVSPPYLFQDSISDLLVFEAARLLKRYPDLNACHLDERTIGHFSEVNFGISFDAGHSLKVLALMGADNLSLSEVQAGFDRLLQLYESGAPIADELLTCSTVTLSDLSRTAATFMLPLLNANQSLIIGVTRRSDRRFGLHASFDHRVSEGLSVARFLDELGERVRSHYRAADAEVRRELRCSVCDQSLEAEIKAGVRGLLRIARPDGSDGYLCRNCFEGW